MKELLGPASTPSRDLESKMIDNGLSDVLDGLRRSSSPLIRSEASSGNSIRDSGFGDVESRVCDTDNSKTSKTHGNF